MDEFVDDRDPAPGDDPPVTAVASRRVKPGREREFEQWVPGILAAAKEFPGYLGSEVLRPSDPEDDEYRIVFRFDHASNLHAWEDSEERRRLLREAEPLIHKEKVHFLTGLETWFTLPSKAGEPSPPRYKMALVTWLAVFPLITAILLPALRAAVEPAPDAAAHAGPYRGDGDDDDLRGHAPLLFVALP
jgi:uncharacterized protein